jgi:predicted nucleic acid-binding protein
MSVNIRRFRSASCYILELPSLFVDATKCLQAAALVSGPQRHDARDALHLAVMERYGIKAIVSFDRDFDRWPGMERIFQA